MVACLIRLQKKFLHFSDTSKTFYATIYSVVGTFTAYLSARINKCLKVLENVANFFCYFIFTFNNTHNQNIKMNKYETGKSEMLTNIDSDFIFSQSRNREFLQ